MHSSNTDHLKLPASVLRRLRQRYHRLRPAERPRLDQPDSCVGLLTAHDCIALAQARPVLVEPGGQAGEIEAGKTAHEDGRTR